MTAPERLSDTAPWRDWFEQAMNSGAPIVDNASPRLYTLGELEGDRCDCGTAIPGDVDQCNGCASVSNEEWRPISDLPDYWVSSLGRVVSRRRRLPHEMKQRVDLQGYWSVQLRDQDGRSRPRRVHRLVAEAFIGPRPEGMDTCHTDGDRNNNAASNLRYGTRSENEQDKVRHGGHHNTRKTHCPQGHPYDEANTRYVKSRPTSRFCRTCANSHRRATSDQAVS